MIKYIISGIIALAVLFVCLLFSKTELKIEQDMKVMIALAIAEKDEIQLFYKTKDENQYSEERSIKKDVNGSDKEQSITFDLPNNIDYIGLRLDLGNNRNQKPIEISAFGIQINPEVKAYLNIKEDLISNEFIDQEVKIFVPKVMEDRYDPFIITKDNFVKIMHILLEQQEKTYSTIGIILSISFAITIFIFLLQFNYSFPSINYIQTAYIFSFAAIIALPSIANIFDIDNERENREKRKLAEKPVLSLNKDYPTQFEDYYNDHFGFRNWMVEQSANMKVNIFNSYPKIDKVQAGKDGFLFFTDITEHIYPSYAHQDIFTPQQLEKKYIRLKEQKMFLDSLDIGFILSTFPNKSTVYSEKLPKTMQSQIARPISLADQYQTFFKDKDIQIWNVKDDLLKQKKDYSLYQRFDSHWNAYGSYFAYQSLLNQYYDILETKPFSLSDFEIKLDTISEGDLTQLLGLKQLINQKDIFPMFTLRNKDISFSTEISEGKKVTRTINPNAPSDKKLVVFRDSFTTLLIQFLSLNFKEIVYVSSDFDQQRILEENPDAVMVLKVERLIKFF